MNNNRVLIWVIVVLIILNIATIGTIVYHNYSEKTQQDDTVIMNADGQMINGRYMRQYLGFDNDQVDAFRQANRNFRPHAAMIIYNIDSLKGNMFRELQKQDPDTVKLDNMADKIGLLHCKLKKYTSRFYLQIKSVCKPEQVGKLQIIFSPLFKNEGVDIGPYPGQGQRGGWGRYNMNQNSSSINK